MSVRLVGSKRDLRELEKFDEQRKKAKAVEMRQGKHDYSEEELNAIVEGTEEPRKNGLRPTDEAVEFRRSQVLRLTLRGVPKSTIAKYLDISMPTLYRDIAAIKDQFKREVAEFDFPVFIGSTLAFFREVRNIALRMATDQEPKKDKDGKAIKGTLKVSDSTRLSALATALNAENSLHAFLAKCGLYQQIEADPEPPFAGKSDDLDDAAALRAALKDIIRGKDQKDTDVSVIEHQG